MKALGSAAIPKGIWRCEIKFDGYRAVAVVNNGKVELWSRNRKAMTADFPEVVAELEGLKCRSAVVDGEIVALDSRGRSRFQLLQKRAASDRSARVVYYAFDLMELNGASLAGKAIEDRAGALKELVPPGGRVVQLSSVFIAEPSVVFKEARKNGLEGIIAKRPGSLYEAGRRSSMWLKCKVLAEQEFVIGGFSRPRNSRQYFGAILVGYFDGRKLLYAGKVGTGFDGKTLGDLHRRFMAQRVGECPFANLPGKGNPRFGAGMEPSEMKQVTWIRPTLVAQVKFLEWTGDGLLRQPVFLGLRGDTAARDVRREAGPVPGRPASNSVR